MKWQAKALALRFLGMTPVGRRLYRRMQDLTGKIELTADDYWHGRGALIEAITRIDVPVANKRVLEIGTGWHPVLPLLRSLAGAREVTTVDVNPWMTTESLRRAAGIALALRDRLIRPADPSRIAHLTRLLDAADPWPILSDLAVRYRCPYDATQTREPEGAFDLIVHTDTLEHVPLDIARAMTQESRRLLNGQAGWPAGSVPETTLRPVSPESGPRTFCVTRIECGG